MSFPFGSSSFPRWNVNYIPSRVEWQSWWSRKADEDSVNDTFLALAQKITAETDRAIDAEQSNVTAINDETARAKDAEGNLLSRIDLIPVVQDKGAEAGATEGNDAALAACIAAGGIWYVPAGTYPITSNAPLLNAQMFTGPGNFDINGWIFPAGDIYGYINIAVPSVFPTIQDAVNWCQHKVCRDENAFVSINVADGTYSLTTIEPRLPQGGVRVQIIGNTTTPANCVLNFDNTNNKDGFVFKNGSNGWLINGFTINGVGGWVSHGVWNDQCYGSAIMAGEGSSIMVGPALVINKYYYGIKANNNAVVYCQPGVQVSEAGDCCYHAYGSSAIYMNNCEAFNAAHTAPGLGAGIVAEGASFIDASFSSAQGCAVAGFLALNGSGMWAHSCTATQNGTGFSASEGSMMECNSQSPNAQTNSFSNTGDGYRAENGSTMNCNRCLGDTNGGNGYYAIGGSLIDITAADASGNTADGFSAYLNSCMRGMSINSYNNGGNGLHANTNSSIYTGDSATINSNKGWGYYATLLSSVTITGTNWGASGNVAGQMSPSPAGTEGNSSSYVTTPDSAAS
ncbi:NAD(P)/FAD-dependent oxidoreductase [Komagataeibacter europaeus]|uniref:hypothetical protein n=1 Tax=Komagataeibacter europaeus TaxID=33995 RepID=UPI0015F7DCDB|nr:hypothetical protein [Komagataeibacter europaeus]